MKIVTLVNHNMKSLLKKKERREKSAPNTHFENNTMKYEEEFFSQPISKDCDNPRHSPRNLEGPLA